MKYARILDDKYVIYDNGTVNVIENGVEKPVQLKRYGQYLGFSYKKQYFVHRLVANAFIPNPMNKPEVNHIDGNKLNNTADNLEWVTRRENVLHAVAIGLKGNKPNNNPDKVGNLYYDARFKAGLTISKASEMIGVSTTTIVSWEVKRTKPKPRFIKRMAEAYGCTVEELMEGGT